ncbi:ComEA family DNA-binding protein [Paenibacillus abyssi]|uniref:Helix-hairpin-helix DNA-binding motif class 1 domain-containing protein n=1 Tax=Paenibacillus abyssi TaxID=1340531 RepID=A0A917D710_9BACL|nr:helix-hairpin-helix domain-containing protein [Paenibacillus abyssi]GGG11024.1 hypothetical protein GCM10010916_29830 [Paenibacillus abyssi]
MRRAHNLSPASKLAVGLLLAAGACLLITAVWMPKEKLPDGWIPLQSELASTLDRLAQEEAVMEADMEVSSQNQPKSSSERNRQTTAEPAASGNSAGLERSGNEPVPGETLDSYGNGAVSFPESGQPGGKNDASGAADDGKIDLNTATTDQLDTLPGIGMAKAQAIVDDRSKNGPFHSVEDLMRVKGIGPKILEKMKESVVVRR